MNDLDALFRSFGKFEVEFSAYDIKSLDNFFHAKTSVALEAFFDFLHVDFLLFSEFVLAHFAGSVGEES